MARSDVERVRRDRALVADARAASARYPHDPDLSALLDELRRASPTFARVWAEREVAEHVSDHKSFAHPEVGEIALDCDALHVAGDDQTLLVYSARPGSRDADALDLLRMLGRPPDPGVKDGAGTGQDEPLEVGPRGPEAHGRATAGHRGRW